MYPYGLTLRDWTITMARPATATIPMMDHAQIGRPTIRNGWAEIVALVEIAGLGAANLRPRYSVFKLTLTE